MADDTSRGPYTGEWYDKRNERRKKRYREDAEYRKTANAAARNGYRNSVGGNDPPDPMANIAMLDDGPQCVGSLREVKGRTIQWLTFSRAELAEVFGRPAKQVQQWASGNDKRIPSPMLKGRIVGVERLYVDVYSQAEAKALVIALAPFLKELHYFRADHKEAIMAARKAIADVRKIMKWNASR